MRPLQGEPFAGPLEPGSTARFSACLACACAVDCVQQFAQCADAELNVCDSCEATGGICGGEEGLAVELIMVVVG